LTSRGRDDLARIGRAIARYGGRPVLAASSLLLAAGLALLGLAQSLPVFLAAWLVIGLGMGAGLYDAAFATLGGYFGKEARRAITALTLWGGFASTVVLADSASWSRPSAGAARASPTPPCSSPWQRPRTGSFCRGPPLPLLAGRDDIPRRRAPVRGPAAFLLLASTVTIGGAIASLFRCI
jgi:MFS family permease